MSRMRFFEIQRLFVINEKEFAKIAQDIIDEFNKNSKELYFPNSYLCLNEWFYFY